MPLPQKAAKSPATASAATARDSSTKPATLHPSAMTRINTLEEYVAKVNDAGIRRLTESAIITKSPKAAKYKSCLTKPVLAVGLHSGTSAALYT